MPLPAFESPSKLVALHPDVQPSEYILGEACTIGRWAMCQIVVRRSVVSRLHARIERDGPRYLLIDAGSANGTFVNNRRLSGPHILKDHDLIGLGAITPLLCFTDPDPTNVMAGQLRYDDQTLQFFLNQQPVDLTPAQFRLLLHLYQHIGSVCSRESCAEAIWGRAYDPGMDADTLDRAISNLRIKLRQIDPTADLIVTRRGLGYELLLQAQ